MKRAAYFNFHTTKMEEEVEEGHDIPDTQNWWHIKKIITQENLQSGGLDMPSDCVFWPAFRCCPMKINPKVILPLWDVTDQNDAKRYLKDTIHLAILPDNEGFFLACKEFLDDRSFKVGDEMELYWDPKSLQFSALQVIK